MKTNLRMLWLGMLFTASVAVHAQQVPQLPQFQPNTPARAAEVNANFETLRGGVNANKSRVTALEATVASLQTALTTAQNQVAALQALLAGVTRETVNGQPTVRFSGLNVQVVSGAGSTNALPNGTGNLIIGYDEPRWAVPITYFCSIGTEFNGNPIPPSTSPTPPSGCTNEGGVWAAVHKSGSHYLVVGSENNYSQSGGVVVGGLNTSNNRFASVTGGINNIASGYGASVSGGLASTASGNYASVSGGRSNTASGAAASVSGGNLNSASGSRASVSGGEGCDTGAVVTKWVVGQQASPGCSAFAN